MNYLYQGDLPNNFEFTNSIAVDTETMGLKHQRDRLCLVQLSNGDGNAHLIQLGSDFGYKADNLKALMKNKKIVKIFHYARFDLGVIKKYLEKISFKIYVTN